MTKRHLILALILFGILRGTSLASAEASDGGAINSFAQSGFLPLEPQFGQPHDCSPIDYSASLMPYRSQGDTGFCYAYSTADMIRSRTGQSVSSLDLAMSFYFADSRLLRSSEHAYEYALQEFLMAVPNFEEAIYQLRMSRMVDIVKPAKGSHNSHPMFYKLEGGSEPPTALLANVTGLCSEEDLRSDGGFRSHRHVIRQLEEMAMAHRGEIGQEVGAVIPRFRDTEADIFNTGWMRYVREKCQRQRPRVPVVPVTFQIAFDLTEFQQRRAQGMITRQDQDRLLSVLDFALDNWRVATVGFDLDTIVDPKKAMKLRLRQWADEPVIDNGDHSVVVVGRRKVGGRCQYLMRDSSGYDCQDYLGPIARRCDQHMAWLTEDELLASFYALTYLR